MLRDPTQVDAAVERLRTLTQPVGLTGNRDWDVQVVDSTRIVLTPTASGTARALKQAMGVARDVVRRRIDPQGPRKSPLSPRATTASSSRCPGSKIPISSRN